MSENFINRFKGKVATIILDDDSWIDEDGYEVAPAILATVLGVDSKWLYIVDEEGTERVLNLKFVVEVRFGNHLREMEVKIEAKSKIRSES